MNILAFIALAFFLVMAVAILVARRPKPPVARGPKTWEIYFDGHDFEVRDFDRPEVTIGLWDNFHEAAIHACDLARDGDTIILPAGEFNIKYPLHMPGCGVKIVGGGGK